MAKEKRATWWKMFAHQRAVIEAITDAEVGRGLKAAYRYFDGEEITGEELTQSAFIVFSVIRPYIDEARADYAQRVEDGRRGGNAAHGNPPEV